MQITPVAQYNATTQTALVASKQDTQPEKALDQQKPQAPKKDSVTLSQAAKDLAAQASGKTVQEEAKATTTGQTKI